MKAFNFASGQDTGSYMIVRIEDDDLGLIEIIGAASSLIGTPSPH